MSFMSTAKAALCAAAIVSIVSSASAQELRKISIGLSSGSFATAPSRIAKELGLFEKHGLDAKVTIMENSTISGMAVISGSIDFNTNAAPEVVVAQARGQKMVAVTTVYGGFSSVLTLSKATIEKLGVSPTAPVAERLKALDGLVIGTPSATSSMTLSLKPAAESFGAKIRFTYIDQPAMLAAMEKGNIDGYMSGAPFYAAPVLRGSGVTWLNGPKGEFPTQFAPAAVTVNTMRSFAEANPDVIKRVVAVFADLAKTIKDRPADVRAVVAKLYPDVDPKALDLLFASESVPWMHTELTPAIMAHEIEFVKSGGLKSPELDRLDPKALMFP